MGSKRSVEPSPSEKKEIAKMLSDEMKILVRDCMEENMGLPEGQQNFTVRNCISLIKLIYDSHASLEGNQITAICSRFQANQQKFCTRFTIKNKTRLARPAKGGSSVDYAETADAAR